MSRRITKIGFGGVSFTPYVDLFPNCVGYFAFNRGASAATRTQRARQGSTESDILLAGNVQDNAQLLALAGNSNAFTPIWYNQATANNATQTTAGQQPQVVANGNLITSGGFPTARFDGNNDFLSVNGLVSSLRGNNQPMTLHFVVQPLSLAANTTLFSISTSTVTQSRLFFNIQSNGSIRVAKSSGVTLQIFDTSTGLILTNNRYLITYDIDDSNNARIYLNGNLVLNQQFTINYNQTLTQVHIGNIVNTNYYNGLMQVAAMHNISQFTAGTISAAMTKLMNENGI